MKTKLAKLYEYRELLYNLTRKEVKVKYKNSALGIVWSMINPLVMLVVFYVAFGIFFNVQGGGIDYFAIYLMSGILPWNFFANSLNLTVGTVVANGNLVKKVYFPREVLPLANIGAAAFNFLLQSMVLFVFMAVLWFRFSPLIFLFPVVMLAEMLFIVGVALFVSALNVFFRDVQHFTDILLMAWFWMTPIVYPISFVLDKLPVWAKGIYFLNPMAHFVLIYHEIIYNPGVHGPATSYISAKGIVGTVVVSVLLVVLGYYYFTAREGRFAEYI
ncbi:MAG: ABC transporter permease [Candidatus Geothermincolia bacterium]